MPWPGVLPRQRSVRLHGNAQCPANHGALGEARTSGRAGGDQLLPRTRASASDGQIENAALEEEALRIHVAQRDLGRAVLRLAAKSRRGAGGANRILSPRVQ